MGQRRCTSSRWQLAARYEGVRRVARHGCATAAVKIDGIHNPQVHQDLRELVQVNTGHPRLAVQLLSTAQGWCRTRQAQRLMLHAVVGNHTHNAITCTITMLPCASWPRDVRPEAMVAKRLPVSCYQEQSMRVWGSREPSTRHDITPQWFSAPGITPVQTCPRGSSCFGRCSSCHLAPATARHPPADRTACWWLRRSTHDTCYNRPCSRTARACRSPLGILSLARRQVPDHDLPVTDAKVRVHTIWHMRQDRGGKVGAGQGASRNHHAAHREARRSPT